MSFKIMRGNLPCSVQFVPLSYAKVFEGQAQRNHYQSIDRLNERGGLDPLEFYLIAHGMTSLEGRTVSEKQAIEWIEKEFSTLSKLSLALEVIEKLKKSNYHLDSTLTRYLDTEDMVAKRACDNEAISTIELARQTQKEVNEMMERLK